MEIKSCKKGHLLTPENISIINIGNGKVKRLCKTCISIRVKIQLEKSREKRFDLRKEKIATWKREISDIDLCWAAGHFEGEGTITISAKQREGYARPTASLCSTDLQVIELFNSWWPTSRAGCKPRFPKCNSNAKPVHRWEINSAFKVRAFIDQIEPFLKTDRCKEKFVVVSEFTNKVLEPSQGVRKQRYPEYKEMIMRLNHRGIAPFIPSSERLIEHARSNDLMPKIENK